jgi:hypothetical protein
MDIKDVKAEFSGFGPIPSSRTTFAQGIGLGGSFAPIWTTEPKLPERRQTISNQSIPEAVTYPFHLTVASVTVGTTQVSKIRIQYGEIDGVPPNGMTQGDDYLLEPGNSFIYLIVTFDGNGRINSRTIGFANPVPDDTNDTKHIVIGEVAYGGGLYTIVNQNIAQDIYPEKAVVVDRSNESFVYSLFADPRKINAIYELENFNVNLDGNNLTTTLYLKSEDNAEYLELKKDSTIGEVALDGFSGNSSQNFVISANDTDSTTKIALFDSGSENYLESKVDTEKTNTSIYGFSKNNACNFLIKADNENQISCAKVYGLDNNVYGSLQTESGKSSVYGYANNQAQNFVLSSDDNTGKSQINLFDSGSSNYFASIVDSSSKVSVNGYSNNQEQQFLIQADSTIGICKSALFDSGSATYLESKVDTDNSKASVYGYAGSNAQNFNIVSDSTNDISKLELYDSSSENFVTVKTAGADQTGLYGYYNQENYFDLKGDQNGSQLELFSNINNCYCKLKTSSTETSLYGYIDEQSEYFILKAKSEDTQLYLGSGSNYVKIDIPDNNGTLLNAYWQEIDICVNGTPKKMKVLGTAPY